MAKKWSDPLEKLLEADEKANTVEHYLKNASNRKTPRKEKDKAEYEITELDVNEVIRWKYKDRPENELGDIKELAETFKKIGQQQPCIVRHSKITQGKYELIIGERRWRAAGLIDKKLKVIVKELDDKTAALVQAVENEKRSDISEFAKGMSYADKIQAGLITQKDLTETLGISKQQVTRLLSYKKIPAPLFDSIKDFRKVSSRTAYELVRLSNKSNEHLQALMELSEKIRDGKYGQKRIEKEIKKRLCKEKRIIRENKKISGQDGRHLFTWRLDNNSIPSIHFPKDIIKLINEDFINFDDITQGIKKCLEKRLLTLNFTESPRGDSMNCKKE